GFAVVADEVSKLAINSKTAAKEISSLIKENVKSANEGHKKAQQGEKVLHEINQQSSKVAIMMEEAVMAAKTQAQKIEALTEEISGIREASNEQALAVSEVSRTIIDIEGVTQENASSSEQAASAAEELSAQAQMLADLIEEVASHVDSTRSKHLGVNGGTQPNETPALEPHMVEAVENQGTDFWPTKAEPATSNAGFSGF
ncbi:MAG: methyl-accepting chemotaxis protein, partial [SAR324 cluster bacterium]|nr:methyl-accepting chemotaxis protein [SAR324 cluster bacterium]